MHSKAVTVDCSPTRLVLGVATNQKPVFAISSVLRKLTLVCRIGEATEHNVPYSNLVFAKWDFGMTKPKGIEIQQSEMKTTMKLLVATGSKMVTTRKTWAVRFAVNVVVLATLAGFLALIYFMTSQFVPDWQREYCNKSAAADDGEEFRLAFSFYFFFKAATAFINDIVGILSDLRCSKTLSDLFN